MNAFINGRKSDVIRMSDGRFRIQVPEISAHQLGKQNTVSVRTASGTAQVCVSALSYVDSLLNASMYENDPDAQYAAAALFRYSEAADELKKQNGGI